MSFRYLQPPPPSPSYPTRISFPLIPISPALPQKKLVQVPVEKVVYRDNVVPVEKFVEKAVVETVAVPIERLVEKKVVRNVVVEVPVEKIVYRDRFVDADSEENEYVQVPPHHHHQSKPCILVCFRNLRIWGGPGGVGWGLGVCVCIGVEGRGGGGVPAESKLSCPSI